MTESSSPAYRTRELYYKDLARQRGESYALALAADDVVKARARAEKAEKERDDFGEKLAAAECLLHEAETGAVQVNDDIRRGLEIEADLRKVKDTLSEIAGAVVKLRDAWNDLDYSDCTACECECCRAYPVCIAVIELERLAPDDLAEVHPQSAAPVRRAKRPEPPRAPASAAKPRIHSEGRRSCE